MSRVAMHVNGRIYENWKSISITQSMEAISGSFSLGLREPVDETVARSAQSVSSWLGIKNQPWLIIEEDSCVITVDKEPVINGYVDRRSPRFDATSRELTVRGRDKAAMLVDCSAILDKWSFKNVTVLDIARKLAAPYGIAVSMQQGLDVPEALPDVAISPGDRSFDVILKAARMAGVLVVSDGAGGILITRAGTEKADPIIEGINMLSGAVDFDASQRYAKYVGVTQVPRDPARVRAVATDAGVRRTSRQLLVRPEASVTTKHVRRRVDWEARIRAAKSEAVTATVQGWQQGSGKRWVPNTIAYVRSPTIGIDGDMMISQVRYEIGTGGEFSTITLVRPDAFTPEPLAVVRKVGKSKSKFDWKVPSA